MTKTRIIQTKIFLFDISKKFIDPEKDLDKITEIMNDWCWDNNIINDEYTTMDVMFGDGYVVGTLHYSKFKSLKVET